MFPRDEDVSLPLNLCPKMGIKSPITWVAPLSKWCHILEIMAWICWENKKGKIRGATLEWKGITDRKNVKVNCSSWIAYIRNLPGQPLIQWKIKKMKSTGKINNKHLVDRFNCNLMQQNSMLDIERSCVSFTKPTRTYQNWVLIFQPFYNRWQPFILSNQSFYLLKI